MRYKPKFVVKFIEKNKEGGKFLCRVSAFSYVKKYYPDIYYTEFEKVIYIRCNNKRVARIMKR